MDQESFNQGLIVGLTIRGIQKRPNSGAAKVAPKEIIHLDDLYNMFTENVNVTLKDSSGNIKQPPLKDIIHLDDLYNMFTENVKVTLQDPRSNIKDIIHLDDLYNMFTEGVITTNEA